VVMGNLGAHKTDSVRKLIEGRDCELWFLPAYSPDLNQIEGSFTKVKARLRKATARTREALVEAMGEALSSVTPQDAEGWFSHCGYEPQDQCSWKTTLSWLLQLLSEVYMVRPLLCPLKGESR
jgi:hypothetical protein